MVQGDTDPLPDYLYLPAALQVGGERCRFIKQEANPALDFGPETFVFDPDAESCTVRPELATFDKNVAFHHENGNLYDRLLFWGVCGWHE